MKIVFFPKYTAKGPSSRYRIYNYIPYYKESGFTCVVYPLFGDWYLNGIWNNNKTIMFYVKILLSYCSRIFRVLFLSRKSVVYVGADLFPYFPSIFEKYLKLRKIKYVIDYDDAVFHNYDKINNAFLKLILKNKHLSAIKNASHIFTGSEYLSNYVRKYNINITEIPTSIDSCKYEYTSAKNSSNKFIVGWIGSYTQSIQIVRLKNILYKFKDNNNICFHLIGFDSKLEPELEGSNYKIVSWSNDTEIEEMSKFSVGIMPLEDTPFNNGKCAFKLVQYMAIGIPTISTPLKANININMGGHNLFAVNEEEWFNSIINVYNNQEKYKYIGYQNKKIAMANYTIQNNFSIYKEIILKIING